jgi:hypothetical protein
LVAQQHHTTFDILMESSWLEPPSSWGFVMVHVLWSWIPNVPHPLSILSLHMAYYTVVHTTMHCSSKRGYGRNLFQHPVGHYYLSTRRSILHVICPWFQKVPHPLSVPCVYVEYYTLVHTSVHCFRKTVVGLSSFY